MALSFLPAWAVGVVSDAAAFVALIEDIGVTSEFNNFKTFGHTATFNDTLLLRICFGILAPRQRQGK